MRIKSDPKKLLVELEYYIKYYGSEFKPNQGLEVIIQVIRMYSKMAAGSILVEVQTHHSGECFSKIR